MQVEGRNPLEFDAVVRRFADSSEALADVRVQLQVLGDLREIEEKASASLQETAVQVARFVADAADILTGLEQAQAKVAEVLKLGSDLLDGTELKGIAESIMANSRAISAVDGRMEALESSVAESIMANSQAISAVDGRMEALESSVAESIMANSQAISAVDGRMEALESSVAESIMANSQAISAVDCGIHHGELAGDLGSRLPH